MEQMSLARGYRTHDNGLSSVPIRPHLAVACPMRSIKLKLIASTFILVLALVSIALVYFPAQHRRQSLLAFGSELQVLCETLGLTIALGFEEDNFESMQAAFNFVKKDAALNYIAVFEEKELIAVFPGSVPETDLVIPEGLIEQPDFVIVTLQGQYCVMSTGAAVIRHHHSQLPGCESKLAQQDRNSVV